MFEKNFHQTLSSFTQTFCMKQEHSNVKWRSQQNMQVTALSHLLHTNALLFFSL